MSEREISELRGMLTRDAAMRAQVLAEAPGPARGAVTRCAADIQPQPLRWLWPGRIPLGKLTILVGDPGLGKSLLTLDIAARISTGTAFPDGSICERGSAILLSAEDDPADTIRPRLDAAGGDVSRIHLLEAVRDVAADGKIVERNLDLETDLFAIEDALMRISNVRLVVIDPISAYLGGVDSHVNAAVRGLLAPLTALAANSRVAVLAVSHLRKSPGAALHRAIGSIAFAAAARAVWAVAQDPDDPARRLMLSLKQNLATDGGGLAYRTEAPNGVARISWLPGAVKARAEDIVGGFETGDDRSERQEAADWLAEFLADGSQPMREIQKRAAQAGLAWRTVRRAGDGLGVCKRKSSFGGVWAWSLPEGGQLIHPEMATFGETRMNKRENASRCAEDVQQENVDTFAGGEFEL